MMGFKLIHVSKRGPMSSYVVTGQPLSLIEFHSSLEDQRVFRKFVDVTVLFSNIFSRYSIVVEQHTFFRLKIQNRFITVILSPGIINESLSVGDCNDKRDQSYIRSLSN